LENPGGGLPKVQGGKGTNEKGKLKTGKEQKDEKRCARTTHTARKRTFGNARKSTMGSSKGTTDWENPETANDVATEESGGWFKRKDLGKSGNTENSTKKPNAPRGKPGGKTIYSTRAW